MRLKYNVSHKVSADFHCHSVINSDSVIFANTLDMIFIKKCSILTKRTIRTYYLSIIRFI